MALGSREFFILLRAQDQASRVIRQLASNSGSSLNEIGEQTKKMNRDFSQQAANFKRDAESHIRSYSDQQKATLRGVDDLMKENSVASAKLRRENAELFDDYHQGSAQWKKDNRDRVFDTISSNKAEIASLAENSAEWSQYGQRIRQVGDVDMTHYKRQVADVMAFEKETHSQRLQLLADNERAQEEAETKRKNRSHGMMNSGQSIAAVGAGITAVGGGILYALGSFGMAAMEYNKTAALTYTQLDDKFKASGATIADMANIGRRAAKEIPAPFEQMQEALYDIFSSTNLNVAGGETALKGFARAAVAGNVSVGQAADSSISILNGFKLGVEDLDRIMDVQFETVRVGKLNYDEYSKSIGRAIPSAAKAGATMEELGGVMAFLTRNGLSSAMAATSAARAFDLMTNPKFGNAMEAINVPVYKMVNGVKEFKPIGDLMEDLRIRMTKMSGPDQIKSMEKLFQSFDATDAKAATEAITKLGVKTLDAAGKALPINEVMKNLEGHLKDMDEVDRAEFLKGLTEGSGGVIQAMRFVNLAVQDHKGELQSLTSSVQNSAGAMKRAYGTMSEESSNKLELAKNKWKSLKTEIGEKVIPVILELVKVGERIMKWFSDLSPGTQDIIVKVLLLAGAFGVVLGIATILAGAALILAGAIGLIGAPVAAVILAAVGLGLALAGVIGWFVATSEKGDELRTRISNAFDKIKEIVGMVVADVRQYLEENEWDKKIKKFVEDAKVTFTEFVANIEVTLEVIKRLWDEHGQDVVRIVGAFFEVLFATMSLLMALFRGDWKGAWDGLRGIYDGFMNGIMAATAIGLKAIVSLFAGTFTAIIDMTLKLPLLPESMRTALEASKTHMENFKQSAFDVIDKINAKELKVKDPETENAMAVFRAMERDMSATIDRVNAKRIGAMAASIGGGTQGAGTGGVKIGAKLAVGGFVNSPQFALIGEAGPEVVLPLRDPQRSFELLSQSGLFKKINNPGPFRGTDGAFSGTFSGSALPAQSSPTAGNVTLHIDAGAITISGVSDPQETARLIDDRLHSLVNELKARR